MPALPGEIRANVQRKSRQDACAPRRNPRERSTKEQAGCLRSQAKSARTFNERAGRMPALPGEIRANVQRKSRQDACAPRRNPRELSTKEQAGCLRSEAKSARTFNERAGRMPALPGAFSLADKQRIGVDWITTAPLMRRCKLRDGKEEVMLSSAGIAGVSDISDNVAPPQLTSFRDALSVAHQVRVVVNIAA